ncbi:MAG: hypothetical protein N3A69_14625 [Leptospiraceae bacterium]|nr:hypothetical protein [Leptospiraceae bacterium]
MKFLVIILSLFLSYLSCNSRDYESLIVRKWELEEVIDSKRVRKVKEESFDSESNSNIYYLNFFEDGHLEGYIFDRQIHAEYTIQKNRLILEEDAETPPIQLKILELNNSNLILEYLENGKPIKLKFGLN